MAAQRTRSDVVNPAADPAPESDWRARDRRIVSGLIGRLAQMPAPAEGLAARFSGRWPDRT
jgi:hypothetical protein